MLRVSLRYTRCSPTHPISVQCWASVAAHCWFNAHVLSTTLAQHHSNTGYAVYLVAAPHAASTCHIPNTVSMMNQRLRRWPGINTAFGDYPVFAWTAMRVTLSFSRLQKSYYPDNTIHWPNAVPPYVTPGQHYPNLIPLSSNHEYNHKYIFS